RPCRPHSSTKLIAWSPNDAAIRARAFFLDWTKNRADKLGLDPSSLQAAIIAWIDHPKTDFDAGLGKLYQGHLIDAISLLKKAADRKQLRVEAQQAVAFAYGIQHDYGQAETFLQGAIEEGGKLNPFLYINLGHVLTLDGKLDEAARAFEAAAELAQSNGMKPQMPVAVPTPPPPAEALKCTVKITNPFPDAQVQSTGTVKGTASLPLEGHLWVMTHRQGEDNWWPQGDGELRLINERWSVEVLYDVGETSLRLDLAAIVVNDDVHRSLTQWLNQTENDLIFRPLKLPNPIPECQIAVLSVIYSGRGQNDSGKNTGVASSGPSENRAQGSPITSSLNGEEKSCDDANLAKSSWDSYKQRRYSDAIL